MDQVLTYIIFIVSCIVYEVFPVSVCSTDMSRGIMIYLDRTSNEETDCQCFLKLISDGVDTVFFRPRSIPYGCQYQLEIRLARMTKVYNCASPRDIIVNNLTKDDVIHIQLVSGSRDNGGFIFNIMIFTSLDSELELQCNQPKITAPTSISTSQTITQRSEISTYQTTDYPMSTSQPRNPLTTNKQTTWSKISPHQSINLHDTTTSVDLATKKTISVNHSTNSLSKSSTVMPNAVTYPAPTQLQSTSSRIYSTSISATDAMVTTSVTDHRTADTTVDSASVVLDSTYTGKYLLLEIIGGSVGGLVVIILGVVIILCVIRKQKYGRQSRDDEGASLQPSNILEIYGTPIITENDLYISADSGILSDIRNIGTERMQLSNIRITTPTERQ